MGGIFGGFLNDAAGESFSIPSWPFGVILTGHVLNTVQGAKGGFFMGSFLNCVIACFGGIIVSDLLAGNPVSYLTNETNVTLVFICWYLCNHDLPLAGINVWDKVSEFGGEILQKFLDTCSLIFNTNLILGAVATGSASQAGLFGFSVFSPVFHAVAVGAASEFFPLNKGIKLNKCSDAVYNAAAIAIFTVLVGQLNTHDAFANIYSHAETFTGGNVVLGAILINHFWMGGCPWDPVGMVADFVAEKAGL